VVLLGVGDGVRGDDEADGRSEAKMTDLSRRGTS